jgi:predicted RNase H-like HicB family nuclease
MNGYIALIRYPADSVEWLVSFPDLPGCRASGRSLEDALENGRAALADHVDELTATGQAAPAARTPGEMLLSANEDHDLAGEMVGAVLRVIVPDVADTARLASAGAARSFGFYGEVRRSA